MDNFEAVYRILSALEKSMDLPEVNMELLDQNALDITKERLERPTINGVSFNRNCSMVSMTAIGCI